MEPESLGGNIVINPWLTYVSPTGEHVPRVWESFKNGKIPWTELDDAEVSKGRLKDGNGQFRGSAERNVPRSMIPEITRRLKDRYDDNLREVLLQMQQVYIDVALDDTASPADRLRASAYVQERIIGKVPDKVEVIAEVKPWEGLIDGILTDVPDGD